MKTKTKRENVDEQQTSSHREQRLVRPLWMTGGEVNDWTEDAPHENGQYFNLCLSCDEDFIGHKHRHICRKCHYEAKARYDAMTPDEQSEHDAKRDAEIVAYFSRTNVHVEGPAEIATPQTEKGN